MSRVYAFIPFMGTFASKRLRVSCKQSFAASKISLDTALIKILKKGIQHSMFKKIEIWILYITILLSILASFFFGFLVRQELVGSTKFGIFSKILGVLRSKLSP